MNEFNRSLLLVLIASAVSTSSYAMFGGQEDWERAEALAKEKASAAFSTPSVPAPSTTVAPQATPEGLKSPSEEVLLGEVPRAASPAPREKSVLEMTVRHGDSSSGSEKAATPPPASPKRTASPTPSSPRDSDGYVSASDGRSREGSGIKKNLSDSALSDLGRPSASVDDFAAGREQFRARKAAAAAAKPVAKAASEEIPAVSSSEKVESASREFSGPIEEAMLRTRGEKPVAPSAAPASGKTDPAAGTSFSPAPAASRSTVTFAEPDPKASAQQLKEAVEKMGGSVDKERLAGTAQARKDATPSVDMSASAKSEKGKTADGSLSEEYPSDSESDTWAPAPSSLSSAAPAPVVDVPATNPVLAQKDSLVKKIKRNKLKTLALIIALAEAADLTQAYFLKTTKEELKDKTLTEKAKLVAQKTYTVALLGAVKNGVMNRVVPGILDLKQRFQTLINKKKQTA